MNTGKNPALAWGFALLTVLFWSTVASAFKIALKHLTPLDLLFMASWMACGVLAFIVFSSGRWRNLQNWQLTDYSRSAVLGLLNPCCYYLILLEAYNRLPAQEALPLNFAWPVVLVLLSIVLLRQKIGLASVAALCISFSGVILIATRGDVFSLQFEDPLGVSLALGSTVIWALYWIYSSNDHRDSVNRLFVNFLFGSVMLTVLQLFFGNWSQPSASGWLAAGYVALFEMALAFVFWLKALKLATHVAQVSSLIFLTPFLSLMIISIVLGENIRTSTWYGLGLIVSGIVLQKILEYRQNSSR